VLCLIQNMYNHTNKALWLRQHMAPSYDVWYNDFKVNHTWRFIESTLSTSIAWDLRFSQWHCWRFNLLRCEVVSLGLTELSQCSSTGLYTQWHSITSLKTPIFIHIYYRNSPASVTVARQQVTVKLVRTQGLKIHT